MSLNKYPEYIPNTPEGDDRLKGNPHRKIANEICKIIKNQSQNIQRQVIGLEGDWGSGKSNIIKILENELKENEYLHFVFDTWGHQEDLNRRAILEELIDFLELEDNSFEDAEWKKKKKQLNGKIINSEKNTFPEIKLFWIIFLIAFFTYSFLNNFFPYIKEICNYKKIEIPIFQKLFIIYYLPYLFFVLGLGKLYDEYLTIKKDPDNKNLTTKNIIGRLFSVIQGKEIKTNTTDFIIENEPSNKNFRQFLDFINKKLKDNDKNLILTIDNIDRLTKDKIKSLWSTVNIFFADKNDKKYYNNIWLIIPYDEQKILNAFNEDSDSENSIGKGLIDKTFSVKFRVTSPIPSNWEILFEEKLKLAFGNEIIPEYEIDYIKRIFDGFSREIITPRQIINFVNDLVTIYSTNKGIEFRYLALFILAKDKIVSEPIKAILESSYLTEKTVYTLFINDPELQKKISAITFGVPVEDAEEIIYSKEINAIFRNGNTIELEKFINNPIAFNNNFFKEFEKLNLNDLSISRQDNLPDLLEKIRELKLIGEHQLDKYYWLNLKQKSLKIVNSDPNFKLYPLHKKFCEYNIDYGKEILEKLLSDNYRTINSSNAESNYIDMLNEINLFLTDKTEISIIDLNFNSINRRILEPESSIHLVRLFPEEFKIFNFRFDEDKISKYFFNKNEILDISLLNDNIDEIVKIKKINSYEFEKIITNLKLKINSISVDKLDNISKYINCLKKLSEEKPLKDINIEIDIINNYIEEHEIENDDVYISLICFVFFHLENVNSYNAILEIFNSNDIELTKKIASEIEYYKDYDYLLKIVTKNEYTFPLLKNIIIEITIKSYGQSRLNVEWVLTDYSLILKRVFENDKNLSNAFFYRVDAWLKYIKEYLNKSTKSIEKIDLSIIDYATNINNNTSKTLIEKSNKYLNSLNINEINSIIQNKDFFGNNLFKKLSLRNKVDNSFKEKINTEALNYLYDFASGKVEIPTSNFKYIRNIILGMDKVEKEKLYKNSVTILNRNQKIHANQITFFIEDIIKNNLLPKVNQNFLKAFVNNSSFENYFKINGIYKSIIDIVSKTKNNDLISLLWDKVKLKRNENEIKIYAIKKGFNKKQS